MKLSMNCKLALIIILIMLVLSITGCSIPGQRKDNASIAMDVALNDSNIKDDIARSDGSYSSDIQPGDLNVTGYINYSTNLYRVTINTARGPGDAYLETFNVLVDTVNKKEMQVSRRFDVAIFPDQILVPGHSSWYYRLPQQKFQHFDSQPGAYIAINDSLMSPSVRPLLMDEYNFSQFRQGLPYYAWGFDNLGENATKINLDSNSTPINTGLAGVTVLPGIMPIPGTPFSAHGVKLVFQGDSRYYYLVLTNDDSEDRTVGLTILA